MSTRPSVRAVLATITVLAGLLVSPLPAAAGGSRLDAVRPAVAGPDGSLACGGLVAYNALTGVPNTSRLMAIPAAGGTPRVVWDGLDPAQVELDPAWSPDGRSIAFAGRSLTDTPGLSDSRLYVLRPDASEPQTPVTQTAQRGGLRFPTWSPDGNRIAYTTGVPPAGQTYKGLAWVHIVDLTTGVDRFLTGVPGSLITPGLTWSPRGDQLLITTWQSPNTSNWTIFSVRPDPADPRLTALISNDPDIGAGTVVQTAAAFPAFLPGGHAVLVEQDEPDELSSRLYLSDTQFRHRVPVSAPAGWESQPDFGLSPLQAVYQYNDNGPTSIAVLTLPTGASRTLVPPADGVLVEQPDWQPVLGCRPWPFGT